MAEKQKDKEKEQIIKNLNIPDEIGIGEVIEDSELTELKIEILREDIERLKAELQIIKQMSGTNMLTGSATVSQDLVKPAKKVVKREAPLPEWVNLPWMYTKPENTKFLESWRSDWSDYTLKWARFLIIHLISVAEMMEKKPFDKLSEVTLRDILEYMNSKNSIKWWDKNKTLVRIYWCSLEEWSEIIYRWALETGRLDFTLFEIMDGEEAFSSLPSEEIKEIMKIMVEKEYAEWMGKKREMVKIKF
ncbi:MAG: hypothetical protein ACUVXA_02025 [Candidatus Jordarchaeum sp.]|uniref:hypothetical protein n=1 Tax=Candidatus Jordarchaeum sp. TaxID=2823881 RepID=UPI004049AD72